MLQSGPQQRLDRFRQPALSMALALIVAGLGVAGCSSQDRRALGLRPAPPDAFAVVGRPPLELPPDYRLIPPTPGAAARAPEGTIASQSRTVLLGAPKPAPDTVGRYSAGETALLRQSGALNSDPTVRTQVDQETAAMAAAERSFVDRLIFWKKPDEPGTALDATGESRRLRTNSALGKPVTEGETPTIVRKKKAPLEGIF